MRHLNGFAGRRIGWRKMRWRRPLLVVFGMCAGFLLLASPIKASEWVDGDVFVGVGNGTYQVYDNNGVFKESVNNGLGGLTAGCAFDAAGNLYTTDLINNRVVEFDQNHPHTILLNLLTDGLTPPPDDNNESLVFDAAGDFYVGHVRGGTDIHEYSPAALLLQEFHPAVESAGTNWIELAADQKTIFYTSEGRLIKRFDVSTNTQLADFVTLPNNAFGVRLLPPGDGSGGLLVGDSGDIRKLDSNAQLVLTYDAIGEDGWLSLSLDPDGRSFWAVGFGSASVYRFNIQTGVLQLGPIATGGEPIGICVKGELNAARLPPLPRSPVPVLAPAVLGLLIMSLVVLGALSQLGRLHRWR